MIKCKYCGREDDMKKYINCSITQVMEQEGCCFNCAFWLNLKQSQEFNPNWVIIDGSSYIFHETKEKVNSFALGGCGAVRYIKRLDTGKIYCSNDVWHQGTVPHQFKEMFPNNAVFLTKEEYENETKEN